MNTAAVAVNGIAQSLVAVEKTGILPPGVQLDVECYFREMRNQLSRWASKGNAVGDLQAELLTAAEQQPEPARTRILALWDEEEPRPPRTVVQRLTDRRIARTVLGLLKPPTSIAGGKRRFTDIQAAAAWLGGRLAGQPPARTDGSGILGRP